MMKPLYLILLCLAMISCKKEEETMVHMDSNPNEMIIDKAQFQNANLKLGTLQHHDFISALQTNGIIDVPPSNKATVSPYLGGFIDEIPLIVGDQVKKGQFIASLKHTKFVAMQQEYLSLSAQIDFLKNEYERQKILWQDQITSEKKFLITESKYKEVLAQVKGLEKKLKMMHIDPDVVKQGILKERIPLYAPISGFVTEIFATKGSYISSATALMEIISTDHMHLELSIFEKDILNVQKGQEIVFRIPEASDESYFGEVHQSGTHIEKNRTVQVHGHILDKKVNFMVGMFVEAKIITKKETTLALPNAAIFNNDGTSFVWVEKAVNSTSYIFEKVVVDLLKSDENFAQISKPSLLLEKKLLLKSGFLM